MIDGLHDRHSVAGVGEEVEHSAYPFDHARDIRNPLWLYLPLVVTADPVDDGRPVVSRLYGIAQDGMLQPLANSVKDEVGRCKIHVGNPHRKQVIPAVFVAVHGKPFPQGIGLQCPAPAAVYEGIKGGLHRVDSFARGSIRL